MPPLPERVLRSTFNKKKKVRAHHETSSEQNHTATLLEVVFHAARMGATSSAVAPTGVWLKRWVKGAASGEVASAVHINAAGLMHSVSGIFHKNMGLRRTCESVGAASD